MNILKYRTTLSDFRNRMKIFRNESDKKRRSNSSRIDDKLRKLLFVDAKTDLTFYNKIIKYHSMSNDKLRNSDVVDFNWVNK